MRIFTLRWLLLIVVAVVAVVAVSMRIHADRASAAPGATFTVSSGGTHALNESFTVEVDLSDVELGVGSSWVAYELGLEYNASVVRPVAAAPVYCERQYWRVNRLAPQVETNCFQESTDASATLDTITFVCVGAGSSTLHLTDSTQLIDRYGNVFAATLVDNTATCDGAQPTATLTPTPTATSTPVNPPTPTATSALPPNSAIIAVNAPVDAQPLNLPFTITNDLKDLADGAVWGGYQLLLAYDPTLLQVDYVTPVVCPSSHWLNPDRVPSILTGCAFMQSTATGPLDTMVFRCLRDGTADLHLVPESDDLRGGVLFDPEAQSLSLTQQDATVTCDHRADDDGDRCGNGPEVQQGLNPYNPWDFYSVPAPALFSAADPRLDLSDGVVSAGDAQAVFAYFKAGANVGSQVYEQDLDGDGVKDGVEYDRSVAGSAHSGAPDGVVTSRDAQLALAQFKLGYSCN